MTDDKQLRKPPDFYSGNALDDNVGGGGWFLGQFVPEATRHRHQTALELKWGVHPRGQSRPGGPVANGLATTISVLVRGVFRTVFTVDEEPRVVTLQREGDYIVFGPTVTHDWEALEDCVVLSVRFPSVDAAQASRPGALAVP